MLTFIFYNAIVCQVSFSFEDNVLWPVHSDSYFIIKNTFLLWKKNLQKAVANLENNCINKIAIIWNLGMFG